ncbi:MAG: alpha/beta hydrolase [Pseudomonadota bacterium]
MQPPLPSLPWPAGVRSRQLQGVNGLEMHLAEAGDPNHPCVLLLHGFPDLAWGWRRVLAPLAAAGYHVLAPDLRGYGRTTGWQASYRADLRPFSWLNLVKDLVALLDVLRIEHVHGLVGHDFGSPLAAYAALLRSDLFPRVVLMSAPFAGAPALGLRDHRLDAKLAGLDPPRKHYQHYYASEAANADLMSAPGGLPAFLRSYYHMKSADWPGNTPRALPDWRAESLAALPEYYIMRRDQTMPDAVAGAQPGEASNWLSSSELEVYVGEFARTGFQGGLNWYRSNGDPTFQGELAVLAGRCLTQPCWFVSGSSDWGNHQSPGALARMQEHVCEDFRGITLINGAGHWVQQEQPEAVVTALREAFAED